MALGEQLRRMEHRIRHCYYPSWLIHGADSVFGLLDLLAPYSVEDNADSMSCRPLFVISAGRSGTTLLRSMLVAAGDIAIPPESYFIPAGIRMYQILRFQGWETTCQAIVDRLRSHRDFVVWETDLDGVLDSALTLPTAQRSLARIFDVVFAEYGREKFPQAELWGDQTPLNTFYASWLLRVFPRARFIHLLRDGRDAIASWVEYSREHEGDAGWQPHLERATRRWILSVREALWLEERVQDDQLLEVRYEQLVQDPEHTLSCISDFLGIEPRVDQMLRFWRMGTTVEHKYFDHHRNLQRPVFRSSVGSWTRRLDGAEQKYVLSKTADLLDRLKYL